MADGDLLFRQPPSSGALLFGEVEALPDTEGRLVGAFPGLSGHVLIGRRYAGAVAGSLPGLDGYLTGRYLSMTDRPVVSATVVQHQDAAAAEVGADSRFTRAAPVRGGADTPWGRAGVRQTAFGVAYGDSDRSQRPQNYLRHQDAQHLGATPRSVRHQDADRSKRASHVERWQRAATLAANRGTDWQDRFRDRRPVLEILWGRANGRRRSALDAFGVAAPLDASWYARYQEAIPPPAGTSVGPPLPPFDPCYLPDSALLFAMPYGSSSVLLFRCDRHPDPEQPPPTATVVVPVRSVYIMNNSVTLTRVPDGLAIPTIDFGLDIDADSWTWSFTASLPYVALDAMQPSTSEPVEVEAAINGVPYRLIVEGISTQRQFGQRTLRVTGRGRNAVLADPYAEQRSFTEANVSTALQLMQDALTDNNVPIGWDVEFGLENWVVPGGTWAHRGTWLTAVRTIAEAAGGYVQPHRTAKTLRVLPRYPAAPWDWAGLAPDFELPAAVTSVEAIEWVDRPIYNRVFVSGERNGRLVQVTRTGTAGDAVAPTVVDPLITSDVAGRQRGRAVLSDVGRQAPVSLRLPVLSETGVIPPGSLVRYLSGTTTRLGLVRTTSVSGGVQLRQTLGIETHVAP